jgi:hypothetical protein
MHLPKCKSCTENENGGQLLRHCFTFPFPPLFTRNFRYLHASNGYDVCKLRNAPLLLLQAIFGLNSAQSIHCHPKHLLQRTGMIHWLPKNRGQIKAPSHTSVQQHGGSMLPSIHSNAVTTQNVLLKIHAPIAFHTAIEPKRLQTSAACD